MLWPWQVEWGRWRAAQWGLALYSPPYFILCGEHVSDSGLPPHDHSVLILQEYKFEKQFNKNEAIQWMHESYNKLGSTCQEETFPFFQPCKLPLSSVVSTS